jgi:hypothetical protein
MNRKLAELAAKSGFDIGIHEGLVLGNFSDMYKIQKLAAFIIQDCVEITSNIGEHGHIAAKEIKETFGVE